VEQDTIRQVVQTIDAPQLWDPSTESINTGDLDKMVEKMYEAKVTYEAAKKTSDELSSVYNQYRKQLIDMMVRSNKEKYHVVGIGGVSVYDKFSVQTPKTADEKDAFFNFIEQKYGREGRIAYTSINSQTLNSLWKQLYDECDDKAAFVVPGLGQPMAEKALSFRINN